MKRSLKKYEKALRKAVSNYLKDRGDIENLHQLRVMSRKILSVEDSFGYEIENRKLFTKIISKSNRMRDIDVAINEIFPTIQDRFGNYLAETKDNLLKYRVKKQKCFDRFVSKLNVKLELGKKREENSSVNKESLEKDIKELDHESLQYLSDGDLHNLRKDIKRIRYSLSEINPDNRLIKDLENIQDLLGDIQNGNQLIELLKKADTKKRVIKAIKMEFNMYKQKHLKNIKKILLKLS